MLLAEDTEDAALTLHGKKKKLGLGDFRAFGEALKLSDRQVANAITRFEKGMSAANALIDCGFCSQDKKDRYRKLLANRWQRLAGI